MAKTRPGEIARIAKYGVLLGLAGGIAEVIWIAVYGSLSGSDTADVARAISVIAGWAMPALPLADAPILAGIAIHMIAAVGIGLALVFVWDRLTVHRPAWGSEYVFMVAALAIVWAFNFFVALPLISPAFIDLVPYPVSLISKLLFGLAGAFVLRNAAYDRFASIPVRVRAR
jgi:hypothetical protein